ncbi:hypothetical protein RJ640_019064 [Escallonia rubra]|uniref:Uncharacterized protein n=1 Tax=Escallonia rubra TaxID=112253 RepID=A0AA88RV45_9ASTE|nr:hypothetical protein RJ640_019064 [Escallonia rubra]
MAQSGEGSRERDGASLFQLRGHPPPDYMKEKGGSLSWMEVERNRYCYWSKPVAGDQNQQSPTDVPSGQGTSSGPPGHVFSHKLPESSPEVSLYSCNEFPLRDIAVNCGLKFMVTVPLFEPSSRGRCIGVLEIVAFKNQSSFYTDLRSMVWLLQVADLTVSDTNCKLMEKNSKGQFPAIAMDEIDQMLKMLEGKYKVHLAQTWGPCKCSNAMANGDYTDGNNICHLICYNHLMMTADRMARFHYICIDQPLRRGHGIVWKALRSHRPCFCSDISKFSMFEYPLAHYAYSCNLTRSFAISVRSSYTGDLDYVLELFLPTCRPKNFRDDKTLLGSILATMKKHLTSFKVSSGKELGEELTADILVVPTLTDELHSFSECRTVRSPETLQSEVEVVKVDSSSQQSTAEEASENGVEQSKIALTSLQNQCLISKKGKDITYEALKPYFRMTTLDNVAKIFGGIVAFSRSKMKRSCRPFGILEWPSCKRKKVKPTRSNLKNLNESVQSIEERIPESSRKDPSCANRRIQDAAPALVTIKATYADDIIKFRITSSSTMAELSENLTERLPLTGRSLRIEYHDDEGDWVLLACEKDLQYCLTSLGSSATIKMRVQPIS